jgi:hypothetical protein
MALVLSVAARRLRLTTSVSHGRHRPTHSCGPVRLRDHACFLLRGLAVTRALSRDHTHDLVAELLEEGALSGLCHKIDHIAGVAPLDSELLLLYPVGNQIVADIDVFRALAAGGFAILFQQHGTTIVLIDNVLTDFTSLSLDKVSSPADGWHTVIYTHKLGFC